MKVIRLFTALSLAFGLRLFAGDAGDHGSGGMNPSESSSGNVSGQGLRVLFIGNSITFHSPSADIGWYGNWGMAASCAERDYVHLVVGALSSARQTPVDCKVKNLAAFERDLSGYDLDANLAAEVAWKPEIVVIALGENAPDLTTDAEKQLFQSKLEDLAGKFTVGNSPAIVMRGTFWSNPVKNSLIQAAASAVDATFVATSDLGDADENKAIGLYAHAGIQGHPGDLGMQRIAERILAAIDPAYAGMSGGGAVGVYGPVVGPGDIGKIDVPTDMVQESVVSIGPGACLYKTGSGTWVLPTSLLAWEPMTEIVVKQGGLELDCDRAAAVGVTCPYDVIGEKALLWFDASLAATRPELFETRTVGGRAFIDRLYDVREVDTANRTRPYAVAEHVFRYVKPGETEGVSGNCATSNNAEKILSPEVVRRGLSDALWFGGVGSGRKMAVIRAGKKERETTRDVVHMFLVTDIAEGWGNALDGFNGSGIWWGDAAHSLNNVILSIDNSGWYLGNRTYVNGTRVDPLSACPQKGLQVFDCELTSYKGAASYLFNCSSAGDGNSCKIAVGDDGSRATAVQLGGGDYVYELIAFTNRLTGVERQQVVEYLRRKWMPRPDLRFRLGFAEGTSLSVVSDGPVVSPVVRGQQTDFAKKGSGALTVGRDRENPALNYGVIDLGGGSVDLKAAAPVKVAAGDRLTAEYTAEASRVTREADAAGDGRLEKCGNGDVLVREIPSDVKCLDVNGGRLVLHPVGQVPAEILADADEYVDIPNASFEDWSGTGKDGKWGNDFWTTWPGWQLLEGTDGRGASAIYNIDNWAWDAGGIDGSKRSAWGLSARPHDGSCALLLKSNSTEKQCGAMTKTALQLAAGRYEFSYWSNCRFANTGALLDIVLVDKDTKAMTVVGRQVQVYTNDDGFGPVRMRFDLKTAGQYYLGFCMNPSADANHNYVTVIDDLKLRRLGTNENCWSVPGGDMELLSYPSAARMSSRQFSTAITHDKWTLVQPAGAESATGTNLGVGFANRYLHDLATNVRCFYNDSDYPQLTAMMTFFGHGASASTTFVPPAGTWRLQARLAENGQTPTHAIMAKATVGGRETSLGSVDPNTKLLTDFMFPGDVIVADGTTPVTITLSYSLTGNVMSDTKRAALYVDDVALVKADAAATGCQLLARADGDAHNTLGWHSSSPESGSLATGVAYASYPTYGGDLYGDKNGFIVRNSGIMYFDYTFPGPGTYRFAYHGNNVSTAAGVNPIKVWIAAGNETNRLGVVRCRAANEIEYGFTFRIPEGGSYDRRIGLEGSNLNWTDEEGKSSGDAVIDNISIAKVPDADLIDRDDVLPSDAVIRVAARSQLQLDFVGTNKVEEVRLGGRRVSGFVSSKTHPEFLSGPGVLYVARKGMVMIIR